MKKLALFVAGALPSVAAFADGTAGSATPPTYSDTITGGTNGLLPALQDLISNVATAAWPIITTIVGVGLLFWLGRAMLRIVRSFFGTAA